MADTIQLSQVLNEARGAASRLRAQRRHLPVIGTRTESRSVPQQGFFGRVQHVNQDVQVPILSPGWPIGIRRTMIQTSTGELVDDVILTPDGHLRIYRNKREPGELTHISSRPLYVIRFVQRANSTPTWKDTGNGSERAAEYSDPTTAAEAAHLIVSQLRAM